MKDKIGKLIACITPMYHTVTSQVIDLDKLLNGLKFIFDGRGDRIRTCDPLHPMQVRYQAAPHPEVRIIPFFAL